MQYPHIGRKEQEVDAAFWSGRYRDRNTSWDQGTASPGLEDFLTERSYPSDRVFVPGCGRGYDARALARAGFQVVAIDVVPLAISEAIRLAEAEGLSIEFTCADFFDLPDSLCGPYDWIFEHTFFCAIDPAMRDRYMRMMEKLLKPGGMFLGVFYNIQPESGPPFGTTRQELLNRFEPGFDLLSECVPRSLPDREKQELLMLWRRK